ncbi:hypothetical protein AX16_009159 [Volvariella volvacea WC 439]|nr:hypothetical protein AX16_009159 [Volvariella volvacea WC 439]
MLRTLNNHVERINWETSKLKKRRISLISADDFVAEPENRCRDEVVYKPRRASTTLRRETTKLRKSPRSISGHEQLHPPRPEPSTTTPDRFETRRRHQSAPHGGDHFAPLLSYALPTWPASPTSSSSTSPPQSLYYIWSPIRPDGSLRFYWDVSHQPEMGVVTRNGTWTPAPYLSSSPVLPGVHRVSITFSEPFSWITRACGPIVVESPMESEGVQVRGILSAIREYLALPFGEDFSDMPRDVQQRVYVWYLRRSTVMGAFVREPVRLDALEGATTFGGLRWCGERGGRCRLVLKLRR